MAQPPKLPRKVDEHTTDHEVIVMLFGKQAAAEMERLAGVDRSSMKSS